MRIKKTTNISISIDIDLLKYLDDVCDINCRSRSAMIVFLISKMKREDDELEAEYQRRVDNGEYSRRID